jgi:acetyltransferase-like isoleucine patch superfamily enzyme
MMYRKKGKIQIGCGLLLYAKLDIRGPGVVRIGRNCIVRHSPGNRFHYVTIYTHSTDSHIAIGNEARFCGARISCKYSVQIGDHVLIEDAGIHDTDFHSIEKDRGVPVGESKESCEITIGDRVGIAARSIVAKGVKIGNDVIIGPGSIVTRSLADGVFALGNPARPIPPQSPICYDGTRPTKSSQSHGALP